MGAWFIEVAAGRCEKMRFESFCFSSATTTFICTPRLLHCVLLIASLTTLQLSSCALLDLNLKNIRRGIQNRFSTAGSWLSLGIAAAMTDGNTAKNFKECSIPLVNPVLPEKLLIGYTTNSCSDLTCMSKITRAVQDGVNVIIWSFPRFVPSTETNRVVVQGGPDRSNFELYKQELIALGYSDVIHLASFGGWNGPHLPPGYDAQELFDAWIDFNKSPSTNAYLFDGIDWDLEGEDNVQGSNNLFTLECLEQLGKFSVLAKNHGFLVSMAPAESYLDISNPNFSRYVNLSYPEDWHPEFKYHGWNVYAYILAKWEPYIDFISIQFYESYSHAAYQITQRGVQHHEFLIQYIQQLTSQNSLSGYYVNFEQDTSVQLENQFVKVPLNKLVFGFANGWTSDGNDRTIFFPPSQVQIAYNQLQAQGREPKGFMFWVIDEEGSGGVYLTPGLNDILRIRPNIQKSTK